MGKGEGDGKGERGGGEEVARCVCESKSVYVHVWVGDGWVGGCVGGCVRGWVGV